MEIFIIVTLVIIFAIFLIAGYIVRSLNRITDTVLLINRIEKIEKTVNSLIRQSKKTLTLNDDEEFYVVKMDFPETQTYMSLDGVSEINEADIIAVRKKGGNSGT